MPPAFSAETRTLDRLFADSVILRVPDYQRAYSWTTREAGQLIDDLMVACDQSNGPDDIDGAYFLGAVLLMSDPTVQETASAGAATPPTVVLDVVDGQQRLVTLTILLCVIRDLASDRGASAAIDPVVGPMLRLPGEGRLRIVPRGRERAFLESFVQAPGAAFEMPDEEHLTDGEHRILAVREHFAATLLDLGPTELVKFASFLATSCHFAVVTTRTIDRAHRIFSVLNERGRPLARNDILKAQILGGLPSTFQRRGTERWDAMEMRLGTAFEDLFSHIRTIQGPSRGTIISGIRTIMQAEGGAERFFVDQLEPYAEIFSTIRETMLAGSGLSPAIARHLTYLGWLGNSEWLPPLMLYWRRCDGDVPTLEAFLLHYDRLAFGLRLLGIGADKRLARFYALLQRIRDGGDLAAPDSPLELSREEQRNILYNLRGLHARSQLTCKLLLLRLNDELAGTPQGIDPSELTVEHVLPQKPGRNSQWRSWFPLADERETCTQSLGNLTLVTRAQNDRARNMELARKVAIYFADGLPLHLTRDLAGLTAWRPEQIQQREQMLMGLIQRLWRFEATRNGNDPHSSAAAAASVASAAK